MNERLGEILEASSRDFLAECYQLHQAPPLGSLVRTSDGAMNIYGAIYAAETSGIEPGRRLLARGRHLATEEDIFRENPQLALLLRTTFRAAVVGHGQGEAIRPYLPPRPARVHSFVFAGTEAEVVALTGSLDFLPLLLSAPTEGPVDEVVAACLRQAAQVHADSEGFLLRAGRELAFHLGDNPKRLEAILRRLRP